jgi:rubredoxin
MPKLGWKILAFVHGEYIVPVDCEQIKRNRYKPEPECSVCPGTQAFVKWNTVFSPVTFKCETCGKMYRAIERS